MFLLALNPRMLLILLFVLANVLKNNKKHNLYNQLVVQNPRLVSLYSWKSVFEQMDPYSELEHSINIFLDKNSVQSISIIARSRNSEKEDAFMVSFLVKENLSISTEENKITLVTESKWLLRLELMFDKEALDNYKDSTVIVKYRENTGEWNVSLGKLSKVEVYEQVDTIWKKIATALCVFLVIFLFLFIKNSYTEIFERSKGLKTDFSTFFSGFKKIE